MPSSTLRSEKLDLRLTRKAKEALRAAAAASNRSVSEFVLESALARADEALADRRTFGLSAAQWKAFLAAMDAARKSDPPPIAVPWLLGVARHKLADHYRRRHDRLTVPVADLPEPVLAAVSAADDWDAELDRLVAESVLARLTEPHRTVLVLRYMDDRTVGECAELIGRTVHATEALLVRARRAFKNQYPEGGM